LETSTNIAGLIAKYVANQINEQEMEKLTQWINCSESNRRLFNEVTDSEYIATNLQAYRSIDTVLAWQKRQPVRGPQSARVIAIKKLLIAAAFIIGLLLLGYSIPGDLKDETVAGQPGGHKAKLILADGTRCNLENWQTGVIARSRNYIISKPDDSTIRYEVVKDDWDRLQPGQYDSIAIPRGGQYHVILPDGTDVWLNASSILRIPISFSPDSRMVELSGEAYFEVNRSAGNHPAKFVVKLANSTIEVMGTQFNVKAYDDEDSVTTTVLEGKVQIRAGEVIELLTSNQQARILKNDKIIKAAVDAQEAISWKTGLYQFKEKPLRLILSQACRWYDMEFELKQEVTELTTVWIERNKPLSEFLDRLAATTSLRIEVEDRKIIVHKPNSQ
jgi:transmembrane sensor